MNRLGAKWPGLQREGIVVWAARWLLGAAFVFTGLGKALHPVEFLKLLRQYDLTQAPLLLNLVAGWLPWFEVFCGLLLLAGIAARGAALVLAGLLLPFTALVFQHALVIQAAHATRFCAVRFDCGCGLGEVLICWKLLENGALILLAVLLAVGGRPRSAPARAAPSAGVDPPLRG